MHTTSRRRIVLVAVAALAACTPAPRDRAATSSQVTTARPAADTPLVARSERQPLFGDLHLHTGWSADAFALGTRLGPDEAHRWAKGETITFLGRQVRRKAPLDFLALTDHAEYLGVIPEAARPDGPLAGSSWTTDLNATDPKARFATFRRLVQMAEANTRIPEFEQPELIRSVWQRYLAVADAHNAPGRFTAFASFEWTSAPGNQNLHRCVIFKGRGPALPFTSLDSQDPEQLWDYLDRQRAQGLEVVAIPHNGNISNGLMFDTAKTWAGSPVTRAYAVRRMRNEPLFEIVQEKGASETHPALSPDDAFADFETYTFLLGQSGQAAFRTGSYVRQAYGTGQALADRIGVNPFKYGIEAGTDNHAGMSSTEEFNFQGPNGSVADRRAAMQNTDTGTPVFNSPGGLTGVWAEANTREAIFAALERRETFGTSGGRIVVRLFAGFDLPSDLIRQPGWVTTAYARGVPMGGDLVLAPGAGPGRAPTLVVHARKDPDSANLDRVQVVKVATRAGRTTEQVFDVAWSGPRRRDPATGHVPPVGSTVDLATATYTNTIGAAELLGTWTDPAFDPGAHVTYYARVLEIPTPRWTTHWAVESGAPLNPKVPSTVQERAWTSPIWYVPAHPAAAR